jgi:hypothetical protein
MIILVRDMPLGPGEIGNPTHNFTRCLSATVRLMTVDAVFTILFDRPSLLRLESMLFRDLQVTWRRIDDSGRGRLTGASDLEGRQVPQNQGEAQTTERDARALAKPTNEGSHVKSLNSLPKG